MSKLVQKFLIIDDSPDDRELIARALAKSAMFKDAEIVEAELVAAGRPYLESGEIDCLLLDYSMPGENGLDFLVDIQLRFPELPVVMITGERSTKTAVDALKRGALDYVVKGDISTESLEMAIRHALDEKAHELETLRHANFDELTGLPNRRSLLKRLEYLEGRAERGVPSFAVVFMDLDGLKRTNDTFGHEIGDRLIAEVAGRLRSSVRDGDLLARIGGDEFVAILEGLSGDGVGDCEIATSRFRSAIDNHSFDYDGHHVDAGVSIGYAIFPTSADNRSELLGVADKAMYADKQARKRGRDTAQDPPQKKNGDVHFP